MEELNCPQCGSRIEIPDARPHEPHTCRKCHTPFFLNKAGVAVVGEPPTVEEELEELKQKLRSKAEQIPARKIAAGAVAVAVVALPLYLLLRPAGSLQAAGERAAQALAEGDRGALRSMAAPGTAEDVGRWYDAVHPQLEQIRQGWFGRDEDAGAGVAEENPDEGRGLVTITIQPAALDSRDVSLADPSAATASAAAPFVADTVWTLNRWGNWKLDGRATAAKAPPASP